MKPARPIPQEFEKAATTPRITNKELASMFKTTVITISRWKSKLGIKTRRTENLEGRRFHRLTVIKDDGRFVTARCDCGTTFQAFRYNIVKGNTKSCGCYRNEISADNVKNANHKKVSEEEWAIIESCRVADTVTITIGGNAVSVGGDAPLNVARIIQKEFIRRHARERRLRSAQNLGNNN